MNNNTNNKNINNNKRSIIILITEIKPLWGGWGDERHLAKGAQQGSFGLK